MNRRTTALRAVRGWLHTHGLFTLYDRLPMGGLASLACDENHEDHEPEEPRPTDLEKSWAGRYLSRFRHLKNTD